MAKILAIEPWTVTTRRKVKDWDQKVLYAVAITG